MLPRKIKIFNTPWHIGHQYELAKIPNTEWYHIINPIRKWGKNQFRPMPKNIYQVPFYEPGKYDLAVLHVDQQCVDPTIGKSQLYKQLNKTIQDIPKIVINHGTPFWPEVFEPSDIIMKMKMMIGDNHMIVNSHRALEMWGKFGKTARTIIHGMDVDEWYDNPNKEPFVFTSLSPAGLPKYYNRQLLASVKDKLQTRGIKHIWVQSDWLASSFHEYKDFISKGLIYFNPTLESPMPRSRTEAMLSGACCISLANHGAEDFIEHGKNGFLVPNNPDAVVDLITELVQEGYYKKCIEIGQRGKETARKIFTAERFQSDWEKLIREVLGL